jgi:hypothetical protein
MTLEGWTDATWMMAAGRIAFFKGNSHGDA